MMRRSIYLLLALGLTLGACAEGIDPPALTAMAKVDSDLTYTFGLEDFCIKDIDESTTEPNCTNENDVPVLYPTIEVTVEPFEIDVHEVTNLQYEHCVSQGACTEPIGFNAFATSQVNYYLIDRFNSHPVVNITVAQAKGYCEFAGKRLPSEYEWERVARGPTTTGNGRRYPADILGADLDPLGCRGMGFTGQFCQQDFLMEAVMDTEVDFVTEDGQRIFHLFGNAAEWTSTPLVNDIQCASDAPCPRVDQCDDNDVICKQESKTCSLCDNDDDDDDNDCYFMCDPSDDIPHSQDQDVDAKPTIICTPYADQPLAVADVTPISAPRQVVRGAALIATAERDCYMRSGGRDQMSQLPTEPRPHIGFRCARDL